MVYARISDDRAGAGLGVARQEADCRKLCEDRGWAVAEVLVDNDKSAYSGKKRPGYESLLAGLEARLYDVVVAWHPDRLHRAPKELEAFIDVLEAAKATAVTVMAGEFDLSTASGRMTARVVGAVARHESEQKTERLRRKHRELAEKGKPSGGGSRPFGFKSDGITHEPAEAKVVRDCARMLLDGVSVLGLVRHLEASGVKPAAGADRWKPTVVRQVLISARAGGYREHNGKLTKAVWKPLLDEVTWRRVRTILLDPSRNQRRSPQRYLLSGGLAVCGICDQPLIARPRRDGRRCYTCAGVEGCGRIWRLADPVELEVGKRIVAYLAELGVAPPEPDSAPVLAALEEAEASLAECSDDYYVYKTSTKVEYRSSSAKLRARVEALKVEAGAVEHDAAAARLIGDPATLGDRWGSLGVDQQRAILDSYMSAVVILPALKGRRPFDPDKVKVEWS